MTKPARQKSLPGFDIEDNKENSSAKVESASQYVNEPFISSDPDAILDQPAVDARSPVNEFPTEDQQPTTNEQQPPAINRDHWSRLCNSSDDQRATANEFSAPLASRTVWVIDGHSLIHQVFHALPEMSSPRGEPVGAVFGFTRDLLYLLEDKQPDYLFCAFDLPGKTFRHAMYDQYKIQRPEMDADLVPQIAAIRRVLPVLGIPAVDRESFEADDVMATMARVVEELGGECILVTADKDCRQLITDRVKVYNIRKNEFIDRVALMEDWGIAPEQVVDFQALVGDAVDNVPGVPKVGPKTARQLIEQFGTLDAVLEHAAEVKGAKLKENLVTYREQALLSRELVRLDNRVPLEIDWDGSRAGRINRASAVALFRDFGFRGLTQKVESLCNSLFSAQEVTDDSPCPLGEPPGEMAELPGSVDSTGPHPLPLSQRERGESETFPPSKPHLPEPTFHLINTPELFKVFLAQLLEQKSFSFDTETTDIRPRFAELVGLSFAWNDREAWYLAVRGPEGETRLDLQDTLAALRPILENAAIEKIGQNLKYDILVLRGAGVALKGTAFDSMIADYLLDAGRRGHSLDDLALSYLGHTTIKISELIGSGKHQKRMDEVPLGKIADYAAEDAIVPLWLLPILAEKLEQAELTE